MKTSVKLVCIAAALGAIVGCVSPPAAPKLIRPTLKEAQAGIVKLKAGMTEAEALKALAFPKQAADQWNMAVIFGSKEMSIALGPDEPSTQSLQLIFSYSLDDNREHLADWRIYRNDWLPNQ